MRILTAVSLNYFINFNKLKNFRRAVGDNLIFVQIQMPMIPIAPPKPAGRLFCCQRNSPSMNSIASTNQPRFAPASQPPPPNGCNLWRRAIHLIRRTVSRSVGIGVWGSMEQKTCVRRNHYKINLLGNLWANPPNRSYPNGWVQNLDKS